MSDRPADSGADQVADRPVAPIGSPVDGAVGLLDGCGTARLPARRSVIIGRAADRRCRRSVR
ncbi:hypothetical protein [Microlunatus sp. Gsoil 973]|uniref:hypothetical protein n=1 Tax=Microlunatus sp. Gsoil 973 TaxID=2672569 RepID=UPI0012B4DBEC|nr:hypothetical protein [Microlunatus sp. Gsoil 973]QGN32891.1 hypothetical protein GJV80_08810 [Microlunatus sp. Gsoil 973]